MDNELSMNHVFIKKLTDILEINFENDLFGVAELADELGVSRSKLHRKLHAINGKSTSQFIREYRLEKAMIMLQNNVATASEIAYRVGFSSPTYFNTSFNEYYGYSPGAVKFKNPLIDENTEAIQNLEQVNISLGNKIKAAIKKNPSRKRVVMILLFGLICLFSISYYYYLQAYNSEIIKNTKPDAIVEKSIAVLPFYNMSGNPDLDAFCNGMTDEIISRLAKIKSLSKVISLTTVLRYKKSDKSMPEISNELGVNTILLGNFQKSGDKIKINLQLIHGPSDSHFWSHEYYIDWKSRDIFTIQAEVAELVANQLNADITKEELTDIRKNLTNNPMAYEYYLRGKYIKGGLSLNDVLESIKYFEKAIELDSLFIEPYISIWGSYITLGTWHGNLSKEKADSLGLPYFEKALRLDPDNIYLLGGLANSNYFKWNFKYADSLYKVLRKRGFKYVHDHHLNLMFGRNDLVLKNARKLFREDPYKTMSSHMTCAYAYYYKGQIDSTLYMIREGLRIHPFQEAYYDHFGNLYIEMGDYKKAKNLLEKGLEISDQRHASMLVHLAIAYHFLGDEEKSLSYLNEVIDRAKAGEPEINVFLPHYYARMGNLNEAFKWLDIAYKKHEVDLIWLKADPNLLLLKHDPRYKALIKKVGFHSIK